VCFNTCREERLLRQETLFMLHQHEEEGKQVNFINSAGAFDPCLHYRRDFTDKQRKKIFHICSRAHTLTWSRRRYEKQFQSKATLQREGVNCDTIVRREIEIYRKTKSEKAERGNAWQPISDQMFHAQKAFTWATFM
jgi:hypothetical protein